ncbi:hypothetical protein ACOMHN_027360 [Nucella lapillus]
MPSTGGTTGDKNPCPGGPADPSSKMAKSGSMKVKRTVSAAKVLTKSKSSGSLKKKSVPEQQPQSSSTSGSSGGSSSSKKDGHHRSSSNSGVADQHHHHHHPDPKQNGSLRRGGGLAGGEYEYDEEDEEEVWEEEKKEASIKCLWKKAVKTMKGPGSDSKWLNRASFKRRDSSKHDVEEVEEKEPKEIDPVYSLLKCAADLPKIARSQSKEMPPATCQGPHCLAKAQGGVSQSRSSSLSGGLCASCRSLQPPSNDPPGGRASSPSPHNLGQDFKRFYKQTSPVKRLSSSSELGI